VLPSGVVVLDRDPKPFFVSAAGEVIRIQVPQISDFDPEAGK
jgi:hypothetical protein